MRNVLRPKGPGIKPELDNKVHRLFFVNHIEKKYLLFVLLWVLSVVEKKRD